MQYILNILEQNLDLTGNLVETLCIVGFFFIFQIFFFELKKKISVDNSNPLLTSILMSKLWNCYLGDLVLSDSPNASITILANDNAYGIFMFSPPLQMSTEEGSAVRLRLVNISYNKILELINFQHITCTNFWQNH